MKDCAKGQLVGVLEDNKRNHIHWYQASGMYRQLEGAQVFLDPKRRTWAVTEGDKVLGMAKPRAPKTD